MPWMETQVTDERMSFIVECRRGEATMTELCELYGISRKTGYKLLARFAGEGAAGVSGSLTGAASSRPTNTCRGRSRDHCVQGSASASRPSQDQIGVGVVGCGNTLARRQHDR